MTGLADAQRLTQADQVLFVMSLSNHNGGLTPSEVRSALISLRLPPPKNISDVITGLRKRALLIDVGKSRYALTPLGENRVRSLGIDVLPHGLPHDAELAGIQHIVVPPQFAPVELRPGIEAFLTRFGFDTNVFCITPFPTEAGDSLDSAISACRKACEEHGLDLHVASDRKIMDDLWQNIAAHMWSSRYGIVILERIKNPDSLNLNVLIELGAMLATGRRCLLLKDKSVPTLPTDIVGKIYKSVDLDESSQVGSAVAAWISDDLGL